MTWSAANLSSTSPLLLGPNPSNIEDLAICRFFTNFVLIPRHHEAFRGFLDALPPLFNAAPSGSVLSLATSAVSLAIIGGNPSYPREAMLSQQRLGRALMMAHEAIADPVDSLKDETLMAVLVGISERSFNLQHVSCSCERCERCLARQRQNIKEWKS